MKTQPTLPVLAAALLMSFTTMSASMPAYAYDDDVEVVCDETPEGETFCVTVDELKVDCPLVDPDNTTDLCADLNVKPQRERAKSISSGSSSTKQKRIKVSKKIVAPN